MGEDLKKEGRSAMPSSHGRQDGEVSLGMSRDKKHQWAGMAWPLRKGLTYTEGIYMARVQLVDSGAHRFGFTFELSALSLSPLSMAITVLIDRSFVCGRHWPNCPTSRLSTILTVILGEGTVSYH